MEYNMGRCGKYSNLLFAFCLSTKGNDLSQWRLYGDNGKGVCLGFKKSQIEKFIKEDKNYSFQQIEYFKTINEVVSSIAKEILLKIRDMYEQSKIEELKKYKFEFMHELSKIWSKYKVADYSSENEVRLVYKLNNNQIFVNVDSKSVKLEDVKDIDVRLRNGELSLFKEVPLEKLGLTSVTLGPLNNTIKDSINIFLAKNNVDILSNHIYKSNIPYRA